MSTYCLGLFKVNLDGSPGPKCLFVMAMAMVMAVAMVMALVRAMAIHGHDHGHDENPLNMEHLQAYMYENQQASTLTTEVCSALIREVCPQWYGNLRGRRTPNRVMDLPGCVLAGGRHWTTFL